MGQRIVDLIATVMKACTGAREQGCGHPPLETIRAQSVSQLAALRGCRSSFSASAIRNAISRLCCAFSRGSQ
jgi:hypothetical protein